MNVEPAKHDIRTSQPPVCQTILTSSPWIRSFSACPRKNNPALCHQLLNCYGANRCMLEIERKRWAFSEQNVSHLTDPADVQKKKKERKMLPILLFNVIFTYKSLKEMSCVLGTAAHKRNFRMAFDIFTAECGKFKVFNVSEVWTRTTQTLFFLDQIRPDATNSQRCVYFQNKPKC